MIEFNNKNYTLIKLFADILTVFGHSVRRKEEFIEYKACGDAIPTQFVYNQMIKDLVVPYQHFTNSIENYFRMLKSRLQKLDGLTHAKLKENIEYVISNMNDQKNMYQIIKP